MRVKHFFMLSCTFFFSFSASFAKEIFRFVQLTDTHVSSTETQADLRAVLQSVRQLQPLPEFLLITGDLTEMGSPIELARFKAIMDSSGLKYYSLLGNHDRRWSGFNDNQIEKALDRETQFSFLWHGIQIVGLNSALQLESWGDIDETQVDWLRGELRKAPEQTPRILACHHPPSFPTTTYMSDNPALFDCLDSTNVALFLLGHGHFYKAWWRNNIAMQMAPSVVKKRSFLVVTLDGDSLSLQSHYAEKSDLENCRTLPLYIMRPTYFKIGGAQDLGKVIQWQVAASAEFLRTAGLWQFRRNGGSWQEAVMNKTSWTFTDTSHFWNYGVNTLTLRSQHDSTHFYQKSDIFARQDRNCKVIWRKSLGARIQAPVQFISGKLIIATGDGRLVALTEKTGEVIWQRKVKGSVIKGLSQGDGALFVGTTEGEVTRHSVDGSLQWRLDLPAAINATPSYSAGLLTIATGDGGVYQIDAESGKIKWRFQSGDNIQHQPLVYKNKVFFGSWDRHFYALDRLTGEKIWSREFIGSRLYAPATASPVAAGDKVIFIRAVAKSGQPTVYACQIATGDTVWTYPISSHYCSPLIWQNCIILGSLEGLVYALDWKTGKPLWQVPTNEGLFDSSPILSWGDIFIATVKGTLWRIEPKSGKACGQYQVGDGLLLANIAADGNIIFAAEVDGTVTALKIK